jgi:hypothetical protein
MNDFINEGALSKFPRVRKLDKWEIRGFPASKSGEVIYRLIGWTVEEADGTKPPARFTSTSPIKSCIGNIVTTASGSSYELLEVESLWAERNNFVLNKEQYIPNQYINHWIDGDNWITY